MFSSYRQHQNNLLQSQRFYFNNYQYYNDYQPIQSKYRDDLSKINFPINRKSTCTVFYQWNNSSKQQIIIQNKMQQEKSQSSNVKRKNQYFGIEKMLISVIDIFHQNHYSVNKPLNQEFLRFYQPYKFMALKYKHFFNKYNIDENQDNIQVLKDIFQKQLEDQECYYQTIQKLYGLDDQQKLFIQRWNAYEDFISYYLSDGLLKNKRQLHKIYEFSTKVKYIVQRTLGAEFSNSLLLNLPLLKSFAKIVHPLTIGLNYTNKYFRKQNNFKEKPRIVFLNLDGRETPLNLRNARNIGDNLLYVSLFKEPSYRYMKHQKMQFEFESNSEVESSFKSICQSYSQILINEAYPCQKQHEHPQTFINKSKMLVFPLNSQYISRRSYKNSQRQQKPVCQAYNKLQIKRPAILQSSQDIFFLFQSIIFQQIRYFNPHLIIISYNGYLDIKEEHFNEIVKNLTIISNHKICLWTNFVDKLGKTNMDAMPGDNVDQDDDYQIQQEDIQQPEQPEDLDQNKIRNIQVYQQFMKKYIPFKQFWSFIQHQRMLNNILMFIKLSSGMYSMIPRLLNHPYLKYSLGDRYSYLQQLSQVPQFQHLLRYIPQTINSLELKQLYNNQIKIQLKENRKENQSYQRYIDAVVMDLRHATDGMAIKIQYRLEELAEEQFQYYQTANPQLQIQHQEAIRNNLVSQYFAEKKKKLLLENLQTYRTRKAFYVSENEQHYSIMQGENSKVRCYKFFLSQDDSEQLFFQKYSQIIFDSDHSKVYIINYKLQDDRHSLLFGNMNSLDKRSMIKVHMAKQSERQTQQPIHSLFRKDSDQSLDALRKDIVLVNFSHCFVKKKLYLYWPQKWSIKDQVKHKLLDLAYKPQNLNIVVKVQILPDNTCHYETFHLKETQKAYVNPRIGCSSYQISSQQDQFLIFGGIQDNDNDFFDIGEGACHIQINQTTGYFGLKPLPKTKQKHLKQNSKQMPNSRNLIFTTRLRPKMYYRIQKVIQLNQQQSKLLISGGYGRQFTNFYNCFSCQSYIFNMNTKLIESKQLHDRRLIKFNKPIQISRIGKFFVITNNENIQDVEQKYSDLPKDLIAFETKSDHQITTNRNAMSCESEQSRCNKQVVSFIDQHYRTTQFKTDNKKIYLFGFNRTIRQKIYTKCCSPQFYIVDGTQSHIVHISLKTQKNYTYNISNFLMPRQNDIVSLCLDQDRLYLLSCSPVIHSSLSANKFVLYQGCFSNMNDIINKHQLQMHQKFQFKKLNHQMLKSKTLYAFQDKIYLFGGLATIQQPSLASLVNQESMDDQNFQKSQFMKNKVSYREDYILQRSKNKFILKTRKVQSTKSSVQMISPVIVKQNQYFYLYSIQQTQEKINKQGLFPQVQQNWLLKIQTFISQSLSQTKCISQLIKFYSQNPKTKIINRIIPRLQEPKFVSIDKHQPFNMSRFKEYLEKVLIRLNKRGDSHQQYFQRCKLILKQKNQLLLRQILLQQDKFFRDLLNLIKPQVNQNKINLQQQQLVGDLKMLFSLTNKLVLQNLLQKQCSQPNQTPIPLSNQKQTPIFQKLQRLSLQQKPQSYRFIIEDKSSKKIRYIAIGYLNNVQELKFFRIRFKYDVSLCLNKKEEEGFYYHPMVQACDQIDLADTYYQYDIFTQGQRQLHKNQAKLSSQLRL